MQGQSVRATFRRNPLQIEIIGRHGGDAESSNFMDQWRTGVVDNGSPARRDGKHFVVGVDASISKAPTYSADKVRKHRVGFVFQHEHAVLSGNRYRRLIARVDVAKIMYQNQDPHIPDPERRAQGIKIYLQALVESVESVVEVSARDGIENTRTFP